jgi:hypothetical protein
MQERAYYEPSDENLINGIEFDAEYFPLDQEPDQTKRYQNPD